MMFGGGARPRISAMTEPPVMSQQKPGQTVLLVWAIVATLIAILSTCLAILFFVFFIQARSSSAVSNQGTLASHSLTLKAFIDDKDTIKIRGNRIWYEHEMGTLPGDPGSRNEPTIINGRAWRPEWRGEICVAFDGLEPVFEPRSPASVKLTKLAGRGGAAISEMPTPENNRTLSIYFNDDEGGADWYEVMIEWK